MVGEKGRDKMHAISPGDGVEISPKKRVRPPFLAKARANQGRFLIIFAKCSKFYEAISGFFC
jgi:hypothetical protein